MATDISTTNKKVTLASTESEEKQKRVKNVIVRGLPEQESSEEDKELVIDMFNTISDKNLGNEIESTHRLGKKRKEGDRSRLLRVIMTSEEKKWNIIAKAPNVRDVVTQSYNPKKIFIIPDMTQLEREKEIEVRTELKDMRDKNPNQKFIIKGEK